MWEYALGGYLGGLGTAAAAVGVLAWRVKSRLTRPAAPSKTVQSAGLDLSQFTVPVDLTADTSTGRLVPPIMLQGGQWPTEDNVIRGED